MKDASKDTASKILCWGGPLGATGLLGFLEILLSSGQSPRPESRPGQRRREKVSLPNPSLGGTSLLRLLSIPGKDDERVLTEGGKQERRLEAQTLEELNLCQVSSWDSQGQECEL